MTTLACLLALWLVAIPAAVLVASALGARRRARLRAATAALPACRPSAPAPHRRRGAYACGARRPLARER